LVIDVGLTENSSFLISVS